MQTPSGRALRLLLALTTAVVLAACRAPEPAHVPTPNAGGALSTVAPTRPTRPTPTAVFSVATSIIPTPTTAVTVAPPTSIPTPPQAPAAAAETAGDFTVVYVAANDVLNVRRTPGSAGELVGSLAPGTRGVQIRGGSLQADGSAWVPVLSGSVQGWVNSNFLTTTLEGTAFCEEPAVVELLRRFESAVAARNNQLLSQITHPERGLRVRTSWWNPEVRITDTELATLFGNPTAHDWGVADGSGLPIDGSFTDVILPLLDKDLSGATVTACRQLPTGPTAGSVRLPAEYEGTAYVAYFREAGDTDALGFDWGTWAVGVEQWQGKYVISYLIHYAYEI